MATTKDAEAGWELYRDSDYSLSLSEINDELARLDYGTVSDRMYLHYRKLRRYGFETYIPINQLDVKTLADPVWGKAVRGRYLPIRIDLPAALRIYVADDPVLLRGVATEISDGEALVVLRGADAVAFFEDAKSTDRSCEFVAESTGEIIDAVIRRVTVSSESGTVAVRLQFEALDAVERATQIPPADTSELRLVMAEGAGDTLAELAQDFYWLFQGVEATRIAAQEILDLMGGSGEVILAPPRVSRLSKGSIDIVIAGPQAVIMAFSGLVLSVATARKMWYDSEISRQESLERRWRNSKEGIDVEGVVEKTIRSLGERLRGRTSSAPPQPDDEDLDRARSTIERQALPAARHIVERSREDPVIEVDGVSAAELEHPVRPPQVLEHPDGVVHADRTDQRGALPASNDDVP